MRFHISATIEVDDPAALLAAARSHTAAWEATTLDDPYVDELVPDHSAALAATLLGQLDLAAAAELADTAPGGSEWAALLRAANGPVALRVTDPDGVSARYTLGEAAQGLPA